MIVIVDFVSFFGQIIIYATSIKNAYPQQVKVLLGPKNPKKTLHFPPHGQRMVRQTREGTAIDVVVCDQFMEMDGPCAVNRRRTDGNWKM